MLLPTFFSSFFASPPAGAPAAGVPAAAPAAGVAGAPGGGGLLITEGACFVFLEYDERKPYGAFSRSGC